MRFFKKLFWKVPMPKSWKNKIHEKWYNNKLEKEENSFDVNLVDDQNSINDFAKQILSSYKCKSPFYKEYEEKSKVSSDVKLIAYYLTQYHPNKENDEWWGKGTTEWNNVNQAVPQFVGHYQPRRPGELGYYDLRIKENLQRQIEIAKNYGVNCFCFYYYYFDNGERLLEAPLNMFLKDKSLDIEFCYCWANENWTRRFSGTSNTILKEISNNEETYKSFIHNIVDDLGDTRYYKINNQPVLIIYKPESIPNVKNTLEYWNKICFEKIQSNLYLIAVRGKNDTTDWVLQGFNAITEFQYRPVENYVKDITKDVKKINKEFKGRVYSYESILDNLNYFNHLTSTKIYPAIMPMWDNTARRNNCGVIFHGSTPSLYGQWLDKLISIVRNNSSLDEKAIFINAWNEWGEGTYLESDDYYGYAYLEETYQSLVRNRGEEDE